MFGIEFNFKELGYYAFILIVAYIILKILLNEIIKYGIKGIWFAIKKLFKLCFWLIIFPFWLIKKIGKHYDSRSSVYNDEFWKVGDKR